MQRIGGHHGRVSSQTGCATPITADALTGRNTGCRTTPDWSRSTGTVRPAQGGGKAARMAAAGPAGRQGTQARRRCVPARRRCRRVAAQPRPRLSSGTRVGRAAARPAWRPCRVAAPARYCPRTADVAARRCAGRTVRCDTSRPPRCWTGCRSDAAAATRKPPRPAQRADGGEARQREASASARARMRRGFLRACGIGLVVMAAPFRPARRRAARRCIRAAPGGPPDSCPACASTRTTSMAAMPCPSMPSMRSSTARTAFRLRRAAAGVRPHAGDALHVVQRRGGLHHHELPADRAVVVCFPAHAAEHGTRQEHRAAPPAVEPQRARRFSEAQVERTRCRPAKRASAARCWPVRRVPKAQATA